MLSKDTSIHVEGLSKRYEIYAQPVDRLKQMVFPRIRRWTNRPPRAYFREFWALRDVAFDVRRGETVGIIGRNGAGKSTLLQIVAGTLAQTSGSIAVDGRVAALLELGSGFNPEFTGRENVYLNAAVLGMSHAEVDRRFGAIAKFAGIGDFIEQPVKTYSSGMYVRLAFAVVAHLDPKILIVDEALSVGDFIFQQKCKTYMRDTLAHVTKIIVSHDLATVANMATRVLVLSDGRVAYFGDTQTAIAVYQRIARASAEGKSVDLAATERASGSTIAPHPMVPVASDKLSGTGRVAIERVRWRIANNSFGKTVKKGEQVELEFEFVLKSRLDMPIIGYQVQDRHGQVVFGDNTMGSSMMVDAMEPGRYVAKLVVTWPQVASGEYGITLGVGNGDQSDLHVVECWAHNVIVLSSLKTDPMHGIFNHALDDFSVTQEGSL